jgi:hypothetical protein
MILDLSDEQTRAPLNFLVETIEADRLLAGSATHDRQRDLGRAPRLGRRRPGSGKRRRFRILRDGAGI